MKIASMAPPERIPSQFQDSVAWVRTPGVGPSGSAHGTATRPAPSSQVNVPRGSSSLGSSMPLRKSKSAWLTPCVAPSVRSVSIHTPRSLRISAGADGNALRRLSVHVAMADLVEPGWTSSRDETAPLQRVTHFLSTSAFTMASTITRTHLSSKDALEDTIFGRAFTTSRRM